MKYPEFRKLLSQKNLNGAYFFHGEEEMISEEIIEYIKNNFIETNFIELNYVHLRGRDTELDDYYSAVETLPFMSSHRLIVIDEINEFYKNNNIGDNFYETLDNIGDDTIVLFVDMDNDLKKNTKLFKYFKSKNRNVEFNKLNSYEIRNHIKGQLKKHNKFMTDGDISYFLLLTGYENRRLDIRLYDIQSELDKLMAYVSGDRIYKDDIDASVEKVNDSNIFNLLDSLQAKNSSRSLGYLHDLYEKDEPLPIVLHMIQRRYRHMYAYTGLRDDGLSPRDIQRHIGISDYEFKNIVQGAGRLSPCDIKEKLELIYGTDKEMKSSSISDLLLIEYLVVSLCK